MKNRRYIDKSKRPKFSSNEELEKYLADKAVEVAKKQEEDRLWREECRRRREESYKKPPQEYSVPDDPFYDFERPHYSDDGKVFEHSYIFGYNKKLTIRDGVEKIAIFALHDNRELVEVILPKSLRIIDEFAFSGTGIKEVVIPEGVEYIKDAAFQECRNLEKVVLPDSIKEIGNHAFLYCENLKEINIPSNALIGWEAIPGHLIELKKLCMSWEEMHVYEEWRKTHDDTTQWNQVKKPLVDAFIKKREEEKAKRDAEHEKRRREWEQKRKSEKEKKDPLFTRLLAFLVRKLLIRK